MNLLAIVGSPRKGKSTDVLVDKAIEGAKTKSPDCNVKKLNLIEHDIQFCKNCLACRDSKTTEPVAKCSIRDDEATPLIKRTIWDSLNTRTFGSLYAGDIEHKGVDYYFDKAYKLGMKVV